VTSLDGDGWQVRGCLGEEWRWYVTARTLPDAPGWLPARVPGSVVDDLWRAGEVPDPYHGRNSLLLEWVPARAWVYRRWVTLPALAGGERAVLCLEGVDHAATVHVDGVAVAYHEGAFVPFEADVTGLLAGGGEHLVAIVVHPAPASEPQVGCTSRVTVHKSRMGYGWDFCPRTVHQGVWRPVRLEVGLPPWLAGASVAARLTTDLAGGVVAVHADLRGPAGGRPSVGRLHATVRDGDRAVARGEQAVEVDEQSLVTMELRLTSPVPVDAHLGAWWNNEPLVQESFGHRLHHLDTLRRASQLLQADGLRYAVEAGRRRAFRSSGTIPWQLNEAYPNAWCTAAVDHRGDPKPAYYAVRRAYRPWHVCAQLARQAWGGHPAFRARVWTWGDPAPAERTVPVTVVARLVDAAGEALVERSWRVAVAGGLPVEAGELAADLTALATDVFLLDLACRPDGEPERTNRLLLSRTADLAPLLDLTPATVDTVVERAGDEWRVALAHSGGPAAVGLVLEDDRPYPEPGWATFDDNAVDLLPGESRTVTAGWRDAPPEGRILRLSGWNIEERRVC